MIRRGQKLRLRPESQPKSASPSKKARNLALAKFQSPAAVATKVTSHPRGHLVAGAARRHIVRRGETMYDVSKKYGIALNRLARANGRGIGYRVIAGEKLVIPE